MTGLMPIALMQAVAMAVPTPAADPHLQTVTYDEGRIVPLRIAPGFVATVVFADDERIENVAIGNPGGWQVTPNKRGDHLFVRALQDGGLTNLEVVTDRRHYSFLLSTSSAGDPTTAFVLRFDHVPDRSGTPAAPLPPGRYTVSGARAIRPAAIGDDGRTTRICWPAKTAIPAIFSRDDAGRERLADSRMEDGCSVIQSIAARYRFVAGDAQAAAQRRIPKP